MQVLEGTASRKGQEVGSLVLAWDLEHKLYKGCGQTRVVACFVVVIFFKLEDHRGKRAQTEPVPLQLFTGTTGPDVLFPGLVMSALDLQALSKRLLGQVLPIRQATPEHRKKHAILGVPLPTAPALMAAP